MAEAKGSCHVSSVGWSGHQSEDRPGDGVGGDGVGDGRLVVVWTSPKPPGSVAVNACPLVGFNRAGLKEGRLPPG